MQGIQTARILAGHGIPVIGIARDPDHHCCRTNTCQDILIADTQTEEFLDVLLDLATRLDRKAVLYPCHDGTVRVVSEHRGRLQENFHIALADSDIIEMLTDKVGFYTYAQQHGFPIAQTIILRTQADANLAAEKMTFPGVLKPSVRSSEWDQNTMSKAYRVENADEFLALFERCKGWADVLILQEWLEGGDDTLYSCNCYFDANSEPLCTFVARKIRQWPPHIGISSLGEECRNDAVLAETLRLFRSVKYRGLGYVEFKQDPTNGKHYLIEPNVGRPTGRSAIAEAGGVELLYTMYCDVVGLPLPAERTQQFKGTKWIDLRHDFQSAFYYWRKGELTLKNWWLSWRGPKAHTYFSWSDPAPFLYDLRNTLWLAASAKERKKREYLTARRETSQ